MNWLSIEVRAPVRVRIAIRYNIGHVLAVKHLISSLQIVRNLLRFHTGTVLDTYLFKVEESGHIRLILW